MFWAQRANTCLSVTMPLRRLNICFQKKNIHGSPLVSRRERGGKGDLKQQFVQTSQFFLGRQSVTLGWTANLSKGLPTPPSTHNTSSFAVQSSCGNDPNSQAKAITKTVSTITILLRSHPAVAAAPSPPPPGRCWTWPGWTSCSPPPTSASTSPSSQPQTWRSARHLLDPDPHTCKK